MEFNSSINYLLNQVFIAYRTNLEKALNQIGLHSGQVFILIELWNEDERSQNQIAKSLKLSAPTINKMIASLAKNDFITSSKSSDDGRVSLIKLTEKGREARSSVEQIWQDLESDIYSNLTPTEKIIFNQLLEKILDNLSN